MWFVKMTERRKIGIRLDAGDSRETRMRVSRSRFKANKEKKTQKHKHSPSASVFMQSPKDWNTPKQRSKNRFNSCINGDSPSEAETQQDIIWDPASPPPIWNGKGEGQGVRIVEISDIVNRIAPKDQKPVDKDSVLQWIGDSVIPCTPEVHPPRFRKCSVRRQSSNVEDLMKLAKQFDLNMTRQDKERNKERLQTADGQNCEDFTRLVMDTAWPPEIQKNGTMGQEHILNLKKPKELSHEEELLALFDGPTQHVSGRLSPPSANCSQSNTTEMVSFNLKGSVSKSENLTGLAERDFDDDWENDDLLNDIFVMEMTQNPVLLRSNLLNTTGQSVSSSSRKSETVTPAQLSGSADNTACCPLSHSACKHLTETSKTCTKPSLTQSSTNKQPPTVVPDVTKSSRCQNQLEILLNKQTVTKASEKGNTMVHVSTDETKDSGLLTKSGKHVKTFELDVLWGDGDDDDDDDLLYQVCDDVERISASQKQEAVKNETFSEDTIRLSNSNYKNTSHPTGQKHPARLLARSHSVPGASFSFGRSHNFSESPPASQMLKDTHDSKQTQHRFTQLKQSSKVVPDRRSKKGSHAENHTFKRHQSDPVALSSKMLAAVPVKCSAAEIERKKQEAIARRRLRLQTSQRPGTLT